MNEYLFRPFDLTPERTKVPYHCRLLKHPIFAWLGLRPVFAQHTRREHEALVHRARGRNSLVEIGVAEGASAAAIRKVMSPSGTLTLIDPYHLSRLRALNALRRAAHSAVGKHKNGRVVWTEQFSCDAARGWNLPIDFLFLDGDHSEAAVRRDWNDWSHFVIPSGVVLLHDARTFPGGWTMDTDGPVKTVNALFRTSAVAGWSIIEEVDSLVVVQRT